ncbi:MAG: hypothetical protein LIO69_03805 [Oscillospiraceae bacterium]|nr:hypothetical protein [Oscillospiraceae bacterium]
MAQFDTKSDDLFPKPCQCADGECTKVICKEAEITVPIELMPTASVNDISMECCSDPVVICSQCGCDDSCQLSITQKIKIKIPITYRLNTCIGKSEINCLCEKCDTSEQ